MDKTSKRKTYKLERKKWNFADDMTASAENMKEFLKIPGNNSS